MFRNRSLRALSILTGAAVLLLLASYGIYRLWEQEPPLASSPPASPQPSFRPAAPSATPAPTENPGLAPETLRQDGVYTVLLIGSDDGNGNTDTLLLGKLDSKAHTLDFVNIPRDTLINEDWNIRKINAVYWGDRVQGGNGIDALQAQLKRLTGFSPDCYAMVELDVFMDVVDAMGGVWFDVPQALDYEDPWQDLYIHLQPGYQKLSGYEAMGLCRYRSGYADGDLGRIRMQQEFLSACAKQFITLGNIPNISQVVDILSEGLETNLSPANIAFFLRQALQCPAENIRFHTAPNSSATISGYSYAVLEPAAWLDLVNEVLSPYHEPVTLSHLDIVYREGGGYRASGTLQGAGYYAPAPQPAPEAPVQIPVPETPAEPEAPMPEFDLPDFQLPTPPAPSQEEGSAENAFPFLELPGNIGSIEL